MTTGKWFLNKPRQVAVKTNHTLLLIIIVLGQQTTPYCYHSAWSTNYTLLLLLLLCVVNKPLLLQCSVNRVSSLAPVLYLPSKISSSSDAFSALSTASTDLNATNPILGRIPGGGGGQGGGNLGDA